MLDKHPGLSSSFRTIVLDEDEETEDFNWGIFYDDESALDWSVASLPKLELQRKKNIYLQNSLVWKMKS